MSWMQRLYETYENCIGREDLDGDRPLPLSHTIQQAHIEVTLNQSGDFIRARVISPREETVIPATEKSAGRTSGEAAHPLADKIQYCAGDYPNYGGMKGSYYNSYLNQIQNWCNSGFSHPNVKAVCEYIKKGSLISNLIDADVLVVEEGKLITGWDKKVHPGEDEPMILKEITAKKDKISGKMIKDQGDALVRWIVNAPDAREHQTWLDRDLQTAWASFDESKKEISGFCMVLGQDILLANQHPAKLRHSGDKAKLISSNDSDGYTFRGRFDEDAEACTVSFEATQKAHNALRWLITKQSYRNAEQVFIAWESGGASLPDPWGNTFDIIEKSFSELDDEEESDYSGDFGQDYALRLRKTLYGYGKKIDDSNRIMIMGLDSATPGRLSIIYYQELTGSEFLKRIESWHSNAAWYQKYNKETQFIGAPSPKDIADAVYGRRIDDKLRKATVERLIPCVIQGKPIPLYLISNIVHRICNRIGMESWEWEKTLGIACSLIRHRSFSDKKEEGYTMGLDRERRTRDYLFGRLLAVADYIETKALASAGEERSTNAARFMQRFSERPSSTWKSIDGALNPYKARLRAKEKGFLVNMEKELDEIMSLFIPEEFLSDSRLSSEFLLGYHCERQYLWKPKEKKEGSPVHGVGQSTENEEEI